MTINLRCKVPDDKRFDQIVNSPFAIKSHHSSLIQIADATAYVYRRHLELKAQDEKWPGEQQYIAGLAEKLDSKRVRLGKTFDGSCIDFYKGARHTDWVL